MTTMGGRPLASLGLRAEVTALVVIAGLQLGLLAGAAADRFGPQVLFALPVVGILVLLVVDRVERAPLLVVAVAPVGLTPLPGGLDASLAVSMAVVAVVVLRRLAAGSAPLRVHRSLWVGVAVIALALVGTAGTPNVDAALRQDISLVVNLLLVAAVASACTSLDVPRRVAGVLVAAGAVVVVTSIRGVTQFEAVNGGQTVNNRIRGTFTEPNQFGVFCAITLLVALALVLGAHTGRARAAAGAGALLALVGLMTSLSRGSWIGAALGLAVLLVLLPAARRRLAVVALPALVLVIAVLVAGADRPEIEVVRDRVATFGDVTGNPYDDRPAIWAEGWRQATEQPWLGQGPGQFPYIAVRSADTVTVRPWHAHNVLLNTSAELGFPAAVLLVLFTLWVLRVARRVVRRLPPRDAGLAAGLAGALAVVVGQGLVDVTLRNAVVISVLATLLGLVLGLDRLAHEPGRTAPADRPELAPTAA